MFAMTHGRASTGAPFPLGVDAERAVDEGLLSVVGLVARKVVDTPPLTVTLIALAAGGRLPPHRAVGPIALHVLAGTMDVRLGGCVHRVHAGDILSLPAGEEHEVESQAGTRFLLTLVDPGDCPHAV